MIQLLALYLSLPVVYASPVAVPLPLPQAVTDAIAPSEPPPAGCVSELDGTFGIAVLNISSPAAIEKRQDDGYV